MNFGAWWFDKYDWYCLVLLFFQEVNAEDEVTEELASIKCLHSKNIFKIEKTSIQYNF